MCLLFNVLHKLSLLIFIFILCFQDMFFALPLVRSTVGMAILKKQGWTVGQVLGRGCPYGSAFGAGSLQPLELMVKTDQAGGSYLNHISFRSTNH